jgi:hypothetical protein
MATLGAMLNVAITLLRDVASKENFVPLPRSPMVNPFRVAHHAER